jgi:hypothetical protein
MDERRRWRPETAAEKTEVWRELEAVLAAPSFANSKRYPAFLRYVVDKVLQGQTEDLKERTLGIEVFNRAPDYDTNNETIVRVTAGEVRRRLAAYYGGQGVLHVIEIRLPLGSYVPEVFRTTLPTLDVEVAAPPAVSPAAPVGRRWVLPAIGLLLFVAAALVGWWELRPSSVERFWTGAGPAPVTISPGTIVTSGTPPVVRYGDSTHDSVWTSLESSIAIARITRVLGAEKRDFTVQPAASLTLTDLRAHPVILIGGFNNDWTLRLTDGLRFHFCPRDAGRYFLDRQNQKAIWQSHSNSEERILDFALVAKFRDPLTENQVFVVAGLNKGGTDAASEFVTTERYLEQLERLLPKGWEKRNVEVVLETHSLGNKNSAPRIVATHVW